VLAQDVPKDLILEDPDDIKFLLDEDEFKDPELIQVEGNDFKFEDLKESDDLETLKRDLGEIEFVVPDSSMSEMLDSDNLKTNEIKSSIENKKATIVNETNRPVIKEGKIFDVGKEEKELLEVAEKLQGKMPESEWNDIAAATTTTTYTVKKDDWLWKISERFFGSGFYYSKIWSLNPYITNPHEIEPGMVLSFTTGSQDSLPSVKVGTFSDAELAAASKGRGAQDKDGFAKWGDNAKPAWIDEKEDLKRKGTFVQYASNLTIEDLQKKEAQILNKEYEVYEPPRGDFTLDVPQDLYTKTGFDKTASQAFNFKEGFYLNTFLSTNIVQDFGKIDAIIGESMIINKFERVFLSFTAKMEVIPGDRFSIYKAEG
jgi:hypothetical protein